MITYVCARTHLHTFVLLFYSDTIYLFRIENELICHVTDMKTHCDVKQIFSVFPKLLLIEIYLTISTVCFNLVP